MTPAHFAGAPGRGSSANRSAPRVFMSCLDRPITPTSDPSGPVRKLTSNRRRRTAVRQCQDDPTSICRFLRRRSGPNQSPHCRPCLIRHPQLPPNPHILHSPQVALPRGNLHSVCPNVSLVKRALHVASQTHRRFRRGARTVFKAALMRIGMDCRPLDPRDRRRRVTPVPVALPRVSVPVRHPADGSGPDTPARSPQRRKMAVTVRYRKRPGLHSDP